MAKKKAGTVYVRDITDMRMIPAEKIDLFCEDLRLWLQMMRMAADNGIKVLTPIDVFAWIDDGRHNIKVNIHLLQPEKPK